MKQCASVTAPPSSASWAACNPAWKSKAACSPMSNPGSTRTRLKTSGTLTARPIHQKSWPGALRQSLIVSCLSATCTAGCWAPRRACCRGEGRVRCVWTTGHDTLSSSMPSGTASVPCLIPRRMNWCRLASRDDTKAQSKLRSPARPAHRSGGGTAQVGHRPGSHWPFRVLDLPLPWYGFFLPGVIVRRCIQRVVQVVVQDAAAGVGIAGVRAIDVPQGESVVGEDQSGELAVGHDVEDALGVIGRVAEPGADDLQSGVHRPGPEQIGKTGPKSGCQEASNLGKGLLRPASQGEQDDRQNAQGGRGRSALPLGQYFRRLVPLDRAQGGDEVAGNRPGGVSKQASQFRLKDGAGGGDQDAVIAVGRHGALEMEKRAVALLSLNGVTSHETAANAGRGFRRRGRRQGGAPRSHSGRSAAAEEGGEAGLGFPRAIEVALNFLQTDGAVFP